MYGVRQNYVEDLTSNICCMSDCLSLYVYECICTWGNLRKRGLLEDPGVDERIKLKWIFRKCDVEAWTGSSWLRIGTGGGHL
jgi:hypothetical protein